MPGQKTEAPPRALRASWVWCGPGDLRQGAVLVTQGGRILEVLEAPPPGLALEDLGQGLLMPGLVNAHTHLELSFLAGLVPPWGDFVGWLEEMIAARPGHDKDKAQQATQAAVRQAADCGTALLADITNTGRAQPVLTQAGVSSLSFFEALGAARCDPPPAQVVWEGALMRANGVAAHAPYSVPASRLQELKRRAGALPFCMHVAESQAEAQFLAGPDGPEGRRLEAFLRGRGVAKESLDLRAATPLGHLLALGILDQHTMIVHGVQISPQEAATLAASEASLCVCPRSNLGLTRAIAPVQALLAAGVNLALGTDSLASCPDLSLWSEMRALAQHFPDLAAEAILEMATVGGARALGLAAHFGALRPGIAGPLVFVPLERLEAPQVVEAVVQGRHAAPPRPLSI